MQLLDLKAVYSPSDLTDFLACEHLASLQLSVLRGALEPPPDRPETAKIVGRLGEKHEARYVQGLRDKGIAVVSIDRVPSSNGEREARIRSQAEQTLAAMRRGESIIYQATFFDGKWVGYADILRRVEEPENPTNLGAWSYEVEDTKLARRERPYFLVQLCFYSEQVAAIQGRMPERMYVVLGDGTRRAFRLNDFVAYYGSLKERFIKWIGTRDVGEPKAHTYPYPVEHCGICPWDQICSKQRIDDDDLSEVFGLTRLQRDRLRGKEIRTLADLAGATADKLPQKMEATTFNRLAHQARLQFEQYKLDRLGKLYPPVCDVLPLDEKSEGPRGFALLPEPSRGDVFFDMEGDPYYDIDSGLEYLFGAYTADEGFRPFWGCDLTSSREPRDRLAEKRALEEFVDFVMDRFERFPDMHVYHYATYEKTKLEVLAQEHGTREIQVDTLLREQRLVDLYRVVRQSVVIGQNSYSLKKLEAFFGGRTSGKVTQGDESIVQFELWLESRRETLGGDQRILRDIERYNEQDCVSTSKLRDWLLERRAEAQLAAGLPVGPMLWAPSDEAKTPNKDPHAELKERLAAELPAVYDSADAAWRDHPKYPVWLILQMLEYHWREQRPVLWAFHDLCRKYGEDPNALLDDRDIIVDLESVGEPEDVKQSKVWTLRFPAQEVTIELGQAYDAATKGKTGTVESIVERDSYGELKLKRGPRAGCADLPLPKAIIVRNEYPAKPLRAALARLAESVLAEVPPRSYRAAFDLLLAAMPRLRSRPSGAELQPAAVDERAIQALIVDLDDSYLFVQGPPGSGKTYQAAHAIIQLVGAGKCVGVTGNSHAAINNVLTEVEKIADKLGIVVKGQRKCSDPDAHFKSKLGSRSAIENTNGRLMSQPGVLLAGTVWAFAPFTITGELDYMFIDEAGQMALPNAIVAAMAARSTVLLGDPLQLSQVRHGKHLGDVGTSVLEYLLRADRSPEASEQDALRPVSSHRGVLLTHTWRMHEDICTLISDLFYEGRLKSKPHCAVQRVNAGGLPPTGVLFVPVEHSDGKVRSVSEARVVAELVERLLGSEVVGRDGKIRALIADDIIVVTPYNMQQKCIAKLLAERGDACAKVCVGTVDKFQGQEADVVIFSTATANADEAPRGIEFLFDRNRLNVAISRARALAIYVGNPALLSAGLTSIKRMLALNAGCALVKAGNRPATGPNAACAKAKSLTV